MTYEMKIQEERDAARAEGERKTELSAIHNLMETLQLTAQQAMDALKIPEEKREAYLAQL